MTQPIDLSGKQHYDLAVRALAEYPPVASERLAAAQVHATLAAADASDRAARTLADLVRLLTPSSGGPAAEPDLSATRHLPIADDATAFLARVQGDGPVAS